MEATVFSAEDIIENHASSDASWDVGIADDVQQGYRCILNLATGELTFDT